jgi:hypothetical protein
VEQHGHVVLIEDSFDSIVVAKLDYQQGDGAGSEDGPMTSIGSI